MSEGKRRPNSVRPKRVKLPDGTWAVYMGETGRSQVNDKGAVPTSREKFTSQHNTAARHVTSLGVRRNEGTKAERRRVQSGESRSVGRLRKSNGQNDGSLRARKNRMVKLIADRIYMHRMSVSVDIADLIRGAVVGALILVFAMLQTTVFAKFRLFGAVPDLMLSLVIAMGITEGERWGSITGLICAVLIEAVGGGGGLNLLPLLYVPVGFTTGILGTYYYKDSVPVRAIYQAGIGLLKCVVTVLYTYSAFEKVSFGLVMTGVVIPEYFSTLLMSVIPHTVTFLALKPFHKSRAERIK